MNDPSRRQFLQTALSPRPAKYIDAFFQNIRWDVVAARLARARNFKALEKPI